MWSARALLVACSAVLGGPVSIPAAEIVLPAKEAHPGASVVLAVSFRGEANSVSTVQFDLEYDNAAFDIALVVADSVRVSGKSLYTADVAPNRKRILVAGLNQNVIPDGVLFQTFVNVRPEAPTGTYSLAILQPVASDSTGRAVSLSATPGVIAVQAGQGSALSEEGVLNAASLLAGPIAPGELITLIGSSIGPKAPVQPESNDVTLLGGTRVLFDGVAAPLLYAASGQINVVAPSFVADLDRVLIETESEGRVFSSAIVPVAAVSPGLFTASGTGTGQGVALHEDATWNGPDNPVPRGSTVTIFATGTGEMDAIGPRLPVQVRIGGLDAEVLSASATSPVTPAVTQISCRVPTSLSSGLSVPVVLEIGTRNSQSGVTIAVR